MQRAWYGVGLLVGLVMLVILQWPSKQLRVIVCDVGQGDGILIIKGGTQVVVDGGPSEAKMLSCLEEHLPFWDRQIELIVLTNTDYDHMNGLVAVVERYSVMQFVTSDGVHESDTLERMSAVLSERGVGVAAVEQGDRLRILGPDTLEFSVLWPPEAKTEYVALLSNQIDKVAREQILGESAKRGDLNERSVVLELLEDDTSLLLMGDAGFQTEEALLAGGWLAKVDYLKVGHHGSKYASSQEFLERVQPKVALISVGEQNRYGHPTEEALDRLARVGAVIRRTDREGELVMRLGR